jgi:hypothetical protein
MFFLMYFGCFIQPGLQVRYKKYGRYMRMITSKIVYVLFSRSPGPKIHDRFRFCKNK